MDSWDRAALATYSSVVLLSKLMQDAHQHNEVKSTDVIKGLDKWDALQGSHAVLDRSLPIRLCRPHGQLWPATCIICQLPQKGQLIAHICVHICTKPAPPKGQLAYCTDAAQAQSWCEYIAPEVI